MVLTIIGGAMLVGALILSALRTAWGQWKDRAKEDEIYGKPGYNVDRNDRWMGHLSRNSRQQHAATPQEPHGSR